MNHGLSKMFDYINQKIRLVMTIDRFVVGTLLAFDRHMNIIMCDAEETRVVFRGKSPTDVHRPLGLILLRGESVTSISLEEVNTSSRVLNAKRPRESTEDEPRAKIRAVPAGRGKPLA